MWNWVLHTIPFGWTGSGHVWEQRIVVDVWPGIGQGHLEKQSYLWSTYILEGAKIDSSCRNIKNTLSWICGTYCSVVPRDPDVQKSVEKESEKTKITTAGWSYGDERKLLGGNSNEKQRLFVGCRGDEDGDGGGDEDELKLHLFFHLHVDLSVTILFSFSKCVCTAHCHHVW